MRPLDLEPFMYLCSRPAVLAAALVLLSALPGCRKETPLETAKGLTGDIQIDGSSTVKPISEAVAEEFQKIEKAVRVAVGVSGTGGGFKRFAIGETDISDASRPIKDKEYDAARQNNVAFIELPVAFDGLSVVVNKANDWCQHLTVDELKSIFRDGSSVKSWRDIRADFPDLPIRFYIPGTDSGTFDYFKEVVAPEGAIRADVSPSEDDNTIVRGVAGDKGGIGFFGCAYYYENQDKLRAVSIDGGKGPVAPTREAIENGTYAPFSRPLFIYVNAKSADKPAVAAFVEFYLKHAADLAEEVGYVRLPETIYELARTNFRTRKAGTRFLKDNGEKVSGALTAIYN